MLQILSCCKEIRVLNFRYCDAETNAANMLAGAVMTDSISVPFIAGCSNDAGTVGG